MIGLLSAMPYTWCPTSTITNACLSSCAGEVVCYVDCNLNGVGSSIQAVTTSCSALGFSSVTGDTSDCLLGNGRNCTLGSQCYSGLCVDGYCCNSNCTTTCMSCDVPGFLGICSNVGFVQDNGCNNCNNTCSCNGNGSCVFSYSNGHVCTSSAQCSSNNCVDGVCCDTACTSTCKSCNVTGNVGTCTNNPINTQDGPSCLSAGHVCDGLGNCLLTNGQSCGTNNTACLSGICTDGYCCNQICTSTCMACNVAGLQGTCSLVPAGLSDGSCTNCCGTSPTCCVVLTTKPPTTTLVGSTSTGVALAVQITTLSGGSGTTPTSTLMSNGQNCIFPSDCISSFCVGGVCCDFLCDSLCFGCNLVGSLGTCSPLPLYTNTSGCSGTMSCSGTGTCLKYNGISCSLNTECFSGYCSGGFCRQATTKTTVFPTTTTTCIADNRTGCTKNSQCCSGCCKEQGGNVFACKPGRGNCI